MKQSGNRQICVTLTEDTKNLTRANQKETALRESIQGFKGEIIAFSWYMQKRELSKYTIEQRCNRLVYLLKKGADLHNPTSIETIFYVTISSPTLNFKYLNEKLCGQPFFRA